MESEFILTNTYSGYASFDLAVGFTRKYHGLLVAGLPNFSRRVIVAAINEVLFTKTKVYDFSGVSYREKSASLPNFLSRIENTIIPTQIINCSQVKIRKSIEFNSESNETRLNYEIESKLDSAHIKFTPLITYRLPDDIGLQLSLGELKVKSYGKTVSIELPGGKLKIETNAEIEVKKDISRDHFYNEEKSRGYEAYEDLLKLVELTSDIKRGNSSIWIRFKFTPISDLGLNISGMFKSVRANLIEPKDQTSNLFAGLIENYPDFAKKILVAADKVIVRNGNKVGILAGYHWFGEWGRDTFISFKGILLATGKIEEARYLLLRWHEILEHSDNLMPNTVGEQNSYNSIDAIFWYYIAVFHYWSVTQDRSTLRLLLPTMTQKLKEINQNKYSQAHVSENGFIYAPEGSALTWMDATENGIPIIDRSGAAVEIQALWYNALNITIQLNNLLGYSGSNISDLDLVQEQVKQNFSREFLLAEGYFADTVKSSGEKDNSFRPNQLAAIGLPFNLVSGEIARNVLEMVSEKLLTPLGLRTLDPDSEKFVSSYSGDQNSRDHAYHNGMVWPWLFILYSGALKHTLPKENLKSEYKLLLTKFIQEFENKGLQNFHEIYTPFALQPRGAILQAWSTSALLEMVFDYNKIN